MAGQIACLLLMVCLASLDNVQSQPGQGVFNIDILGQGSDAQEVETLSAVPDADNSAIRTELKDISKRLEVLEKRRKLEDDALDIITNRLDALEEKENGDEEEEKENGDEEEKRKDGEEEGKESSATPQKMKSNLTGSDEHEPMMRKIEPATEAERKSSREQETSIIGTVEAEAQVKPEVNSEEPEVKSSGKPDGNGKDKPEVKFNNREETVTSDEPEVTPDVEPEANLNSEPSGKPEETVNEKPEEEPVSKPKDFDCGLPPAKDGAEVTITETAAGRQAVYVCMKGYLNIGGKRLSSTCGENGWSPVDISCNNFTTCTIVLDNRSVYNGKVNVTKNGHKCQRWDSQIPNHHWFGTSLSFHKTTGVGPEKIWEAANSCRDPGIRVSEKKIWCYTLDPDTRWQECAIPTCTA